MAVGLKGSSFFNTLDSDILEYINTKSISKGFVDYIKYNGSIISEILYRGDCLYESQLVVGNRFRLWNFVASFTSDFVIADKFSNSQNVPDWYYEECEWCVNSDEYPFKNFLDKGDKLVPVIFMLDGANELLKFLYTSEYDSDNKYNEEEYVLHVANLEFEIMKIEDNIVIIKPSLSREYN